jgi:hypothetical protein
MAAVAAVFQVLKVPSSLALAVSSLIVYAAATASANALVGLPATVALVIPDVAP